ncbi:CRISPR-associated RAMP Cmr3 [Thermogutta terrifontis]|uniref:CRISPR-associated RAMP Cmr3 n=1 Tax=Thermogutta terrifontis TaxID=1331910 RepID=A0A286RA76_9BACT|nr:type III-B CRISPR module-associated protein Cmr3 [Thermogutta terrifontis]ASV72884.1 CRISPR-associated RAMP Cmr3 [Thermogutta terrifontis]
MSRQLKHLGALLEPLDVLFFRDGRPFAAATRGSSGLPTPQTTAGAIWASLLRAMGCNFDKIRDVYIRAAENHRLEESDYQAVWRQGLQEAGAPEWFFSMTIRGPWLVRRRGGDRKDPSDDKPDPAHWELLFPMPATVFSFKKSELAERPEIWLGQPLSRNQTLPGWKPPRAGMRPIWVSTREDVETCKGFLTAAGMQKFLQSKPSQNFNKEDFVSESELFGHDNRTGIGINPQRLTSEEHQIYAASFLALKQEVAFYVELHLPPEGESVWKSVSFLRWGGEGKQVAVKHFDKPLEFPRAVPQNGQKPLLVLTTPGIFEDGWYPRCLAGELVAAAVPGEVAVSGWDLVRRGPKPTRFAASAGSVYFLERLPETLSDPLSDKPLDQQQGWGCFLQGVWNDV